MDGVRGSDGPGGLQLDKLIIIIWNYGKMSSKVPCPDQP